MVRPKAAASMGPMSLRRTIREPRAGPRRGADGVRFATMGRTGLLRVVATFAFALASGAVACSTGTSPPEATGPSAGGPGASSRGPHCEILNDAVEVVRYHLGLMLTLDDAEAYAAARAS